MKKWIKLAGQYLLLASAAVFLQSCAKKTPEKICGDGFEDVRDGDRYCSVVIGSQEWMIENMRYDLEGAFENPSFPNSHTNKYGQLYTYEAALKVCPSGWHLPTDEEWKRLEQSLGMSALETDQMNQRGSNQGQKLKDIENWKDENNSNDYNFKALPAGEYNPSYGPYFELGEQASFWTASRSDTSGGVWTRVLKRGEDGITRTYFSELTGHSCRCVAD